MKISKKIFTPAFLGFLGFCVIKALHFTTRHKWVHYEYFEAMRKEHPNCIYAFWHNDLVGISYFGNELNKINKIHIMTSLSKDGEIMARFLNWFGVGTVRGSSSRRGREGLMHLLTILKNGESIGLAVDGPKGPRHIVKAGCLLLSKKSGIPIVPCSVDISRKKVLNSWDKSEIPLPFSKCVFTFGTPIIVPADATSEIMEEKRMELEKILKKMKDETIRNYELRITNYE